MSSILNCNTPEIPKKLTIRKAAIKKVLPQQTASSKLMEYLINKNQNNTSEHPVDAFLAGVASTLKTLSPYYSNLAKSEIFAIVQKYEMKMIMEQHQERSNQNSNHTFSSSSPISTPPTEELLHQEHTTTFEYQHQISSPSTAAPNTTNNAQNYFQFS